MGRGCVWHPRTAAPSRHRQTPAFSFGEGVCLGSCPSAVTVAVAGCSSSHFRTQVRSGKGLRMASPHRSAVEASSNAGVQLRRRGLHRACPSAVTVTVAGCSLSYSRVQERGRNGLRTAIASPSTSAAAGYFSAHFGIQGLVGNGLRMAPPIDLDPTLQARGKAALRTKNPRLRCGRLGLDRPAPRRMWIPSDDGRLFDVSAELLYRMRERRER